MKKPTRVYLTYDEYRSGGEPEGEDPYCWHSPIIVNVEFKFLHREEPKRFIYDSIEINHPDMLKLDCLFMPTVRYNSGSTFGQVEGLWHAVGLSPTYSIAEEMLKNALESEIGYKPWVGYFESLNDTEIHCLKLV